MIASSDSLEILSLRWGPQCGLRFCLSAVRAIGLLAIGCVGLVGCSQPEKAHVEGRVVYAEDGAAATDLANHQVSFFCERVEADGEKKRITATGRVRGDGTFTMSTYEIGDGVFLGKHQIALSPRVPLTNERGARERLLNPLIDPRFSDPKRSGLTADVKGDTEVVLEVERFSVNR